MEKWGYISSRTDKPATGHEKILTFKEENCRVRIKGHGNKKKGQATGRCTKGGYFHQDKKQRKIRLNPSSPKTKAPKMQESQVAETRGKLPGGCKRENRYRTTQGQGAEKCNT